MKLRRVRPGQTVSRMCRALMLLALATLPNRVAAQGCAMCQTGVGGADDPLARAMNISILFLMSMPFVLTGAVGAWFFFMYRRSRGRRPVLQVLRARREEAS